jgi:RES domain-containing protein
MKLREHPRSNEFAAWMAGQRANLKPVAGEFYRVAGPAHTTAKELVAGVGAYLAGGRWNPLEVMNVVYLSEDSETALREANEHFRYHRLPIWTGMPRVIVAVRVEIDAMLDLTDPAVAKTLPEPMKSLLAEVWQAIIARGEESSGQAIGRLAYHAKVKALRLPSKPDPHGVNLAIFPQLLTKLDKLEVLNAGELDRIGR